MAGEEVQKERGASLGAAAAASEGEKQGGERGGAGASAGAQPEAPSATSSGLFQKRSGPKRVKQKTLSDLGTDEDSSHIEYVHLTTEGTTGACLLTALFKLSASNSERHLQR